MSLSERLLREFMFRNENQQKARAIAEKLNKNYFHHGHALSRTEAVSLELKIADRDEAIEELMVQIWHDLSDEMQCRKPFSPLELVRLNPACAALFAPFRFTGLYQ